MSYIGQGLPADVFAGFTIDKFTGTGVASQALTLTKAPLGETALLVTIDGVVQEPTDDFTVSGTTLTLVGTAANNSEINVTHLSGTVPNTLASAVDVNGLSDGIILDADADTTISADTDDQIDFKAGGTDRMSVTSSGIDVTGAITASSASSINVTGGSALTLKSTDAGSSAGPVLKLQRESGSPAVNDVIGVIKIEGRNDNSEDIVYQQYQHLIADETDGTEDGYFIFSQMKAGTLTERYRLETGTFVINDPGNDFDFRVESESNANAIFVDASSGRVGINEGTMTSYSLNVTHNTSNEGIAIFKHDHGTPEGIVIRFGGASPDGTSANFIEAFDTTTTRFIVQSDGDVKNHDNSYGSTSDERIKQGIRDANSQWDDIKALKVRNFKKNDDVEQYGDKAWEQIGVIAQELEASGMDKLVKNEVLWDKDDLEVKNGKATEGDIKEYKSVKYSVLYMKAIKALQEAMAKIETLETKVKALEDA